MFRNRHRFNTDRTADFSHPSSSVAKKLRYPFFVSAHIGFSPKAVPLYPHEATARIIRLNRDFESHPTYSCCRGHWRGRLHTLGRSSTTRQRCAPERRFIVRATADLRSRIADARANGVGWMTSSRAQCVSPLGQGQFDGGQGRRLRRFIFMPRRRNRHSRSRSGVGDRLDAKKAVAARSAEL